MFDSRKHRTVAAVVAIAYVAIQSFQWYVFAQLPETGAPVDMLLQGPTPLNLARAVLMLFSFFGLAYLFLVTCGIVARRKAELAIAAFLACFVFCLLEVGLRSAELFYVFLELPSRYAGAASAAAQAQVLEAQATFQAVQHALYFPLGLCWMIGSALIALGLGARRFDWLAQWGFGLNALRLLLRSFDVYVLGPEFDALYGTLYLPLVFLTFVPIAAWLLLRKDGGD